jgi:hypothetical protein
MAETFKCKEPGCTEEVEYVPAPVYGLLIQSPANPGPQKKTVYLTCAKQHTYPYQVGG